MSNKMLIDASHQEETRVVVVRGNRIDEFDFESEHKKQIKGNIYLARVTRVEPSLQAAFVEYGGNRHGFLAFSEIHPDYYQIPVADRQALLEAEAQAASDDDDDEAPAESRARDQQERGDKSRRNKRRGRRGGSRNEDETVAASAEDGTPTDDAQTDNTEAEANTAEGEQGAGENEAPASEADTDDNGPALAAAIEADVISEPVGGLEDAGDSEEPASSDDDAKSFGQENGDEQDRHGVPEETREVESIGSEDALEEVPTRQRTQRRHYNIQDVIKRRQILLVQVVKEERGNKGAALTTYLSLAGRYSVLMPNTARGGGISRKITNVQDRKRLKEIVKELEVPKGMGVILRTAGANRTKAEVKRDYEYLMRLWENVRTLTLESTAPTLVYEEGSLIKRSIRDLYNKDISEVQVSGENGYREAKDFMRMLMPSHAKVVQPYRDPVPIFARNGIEAQLDRLLQPQVTLKSGGYIIINQTEALVAIDVNSGRSTREHSIEDTALQTNLEAAEEVARQLRLRDLAGLVVIDFIDMEEKRNNRAVEKRLKDCLKDDRARIQVGHISHFGLLEMSRQRIRASVLESTTQVCSVCGGTGHVRSDSSLALHVIRTIEEYLQRHSQNNIIVRTPVATALYVLNHKRQTLSELEQRFGLTISIEADDNIGSQHLVIEKGSVAAGPVTPAVQPVVPIIEIEEDDFIEEDESVEEAAEAQATAREDDNGDSSSRKRRRRRRRRGGSDQSDSAAPENVETIAISTGGTAEDEDGDETEKPAADATSADDDRRKRRRRGRRGGRKNRAADDAVSAESEGASDDGAVDLPSDEPQADTPVIEASNAEPVEAAASEDLVVAEVEVEAVEEKPVKKRATRRKKAEPVAEAEATVEADVVVEEKPKAVKAKKEAAPRKPRKSTKKAAVEEEAVTAQAEAPVEPAVEPASEAVTAEEPVPAPVETAVEPEPKPAKEPVITSSTPDNAAKSDTPPKRGWWQKKGFF
ncbi:MAG: Rne/Rng family ribonuclease [Phyllobacterium sp.]